MPVFMILLFLAAALLWLLLAFAFRPIGRLFGKLLDDAKSAMFENKNEKESFDEEE